MAIESYGSTGPQVHRSAFVHSSAQLLGDVWVGEESSVWPTVVLRGDNGWIRLGARTNVQDGTIGHATLGVSNTTVGDECTIGHRVILHGCTIGHRCLVGMGSIVLDNVELGEGCFVAAGSLLTPNKKFEPGSFIIGSPARRLREVKAAERESIAHASAVYLELARTYRNA